jgi:hypothetical protein
MEIMVEIMGSGLTLLYYLVNYDPWHANHEFIILEHCIT